MRFVRFLPPLVLLCTLATCLAFAQDSAVGDSVTAPVPAAGIGWGGFLVGYVLKYVVPLATAWLFKQWNVAVDWLNEKSNFVKMAVYVGFTLVGMYLFQLLGLGWDRSTDPTHLAPDFFTNILVAIVSTLQVKLGIRTEQTRLAKMSPQAAAEYRARLMPTHLASRGS